MFIFSELGPLFDHTRPIICFHLAAQPVLIAAYPVECGSQQGAAIMCLLFIVGTGHGRQITGAPCLRHQGGNGAVKRPKTRTTDEHAALARSCQPDAPAPQVQHRILIHLKAVGAVITRIRRGALCCTISHQQVARWSAYIPTPAPHLQIQQGRCPALYVAGNPKHSF